MRENTKARNSPALTTLTLPLSNTEKVKRNVASAWCTKSLRTDSPTGTTPPKCGKLCGRRTILSGERELKCVVGGDRRE